jgi:quinol monooxygenase YgiN
MTEITRYKLEAGCAELSKFDHLAKSGDFIEVSLWHNGEGFDAHLSTHAEQTIKLSWGEFKALKKLIKELDG